MSYYTSNHILERAPFRRPFLCGQHYKSRQGRETLPLQFEHIIADRTIVASLDTRCVGSCGGVFCRRVTRHLTQPYTYSAEKAQRAVPLLWNDSAGQKNKDTDRCPYANPSLCELGLHHAFDHIEHAIGETPFVVVPTK